MATDWTQEQIETLLETLKRIASREIAVPLPGGQGWMGLFGGDYTRGATDSGGTLNRLAAVSVSESSLVNTTLVRVVDVDPSVTITLASERALYEGLLTIVKDETGNAGDHYITLVGEGGETFDGATEAYISTDRGYLVLYSDGSNYRIIWTDTMGDESLGPDSVGSFHLQETGVVPAVYGSANAIPVLTVDEDGRVSEASTVTVKPFRTGEFIPHLLSGGLAGAVRCEGRTIGSLASAATERANADTHDLFVMLWGSFAQAQAEVIGGRGVSAEADWLADKQIRLPDLQGRTLFGHDVLQARLHTANWGAAPTLPGLTGGQDQITLTQAQMPSHTHLNDTYVFATAATHSHNGSGASGHSGSYTGFSSFNSLATGGSQPHPNVPPGMLVTWWLGL